MKQVAREVTITSDEYRDILAALDTVAIVLDEGIGNRKSSDAALRLRSLRSELMDQWDGGRRVVVDQHKQPIG